MTIIIYFKLFFKYNLTFFTKLMCSLLLFFFLFLFNQINFVFAQDNPNSFYVSTTGNDSNLGTDTQPWKTIQKAINSATAGNTIYVKAGTYNESIEITKSGISNNPIKLTNFNDQTVTINGGTNPAITIGWTKPSPKYWIIVGLRLFSTNKYTLLFDGWDLNGTSNGVDNIIIRNNYISGSLSIYGAYNLIENNEVDGTNNDGNGGNGIQDSYDVSHHNIFRNNNVHNFSIRGIWSMHRTHDNLFENNYVHDCGDQCINTDGYGNVEWRHIIRGNRLENCGSGIELENNFDSIAENNTISNSTIVGIDSINYGRNVPPLSYPDTPWSQGGKRCEIGGENNQYGDLNNDNDCEGDITNNIIRQNLIINTTGTGGINIFHAGGVKVLGNTLYNNGTYASLYLACKTTGILNIYCPQTEIRNNIFANSKADTEILLNDLSSISIDSNNLFYDTTSQKAYEIDGVWTSYTLAQYKTATAKGTGSFYGNPFFVDPVNNNFHLQASSPAINSGVNIGLSKDLEGNNRPQGTGYDIGAYEFDGIIPISTPELTAKPTSIPTKTCSQQCVGYDWSTSGLVQKANYACVGVSTHHGEITDGVQCFCATCTPLLSCNEIKTSNSIVVKGEEIIFSCLGSGRDARYAQFSITKKSDGINVKRSNFISLVNGKSDWIYNTSTIPVSGSYYVDCRICKENTDVNCTQWGKAGIN